MSEFPSKKSQVIWFRKQLESQPSQKKEHIIMLNIKTRLDQMMARATQVHGFTLNADDEGRQVAVPVTDARNAFMKEMSEMVPDPTEQAKVLIEAWGNKDKMTALNELRVEAVGNYIFSDSNFMNMFFDVDTLGDSDEPAYTNDTMQEISIGLMGEDGTPEMVRVVKPEARTTVGLHFISSRVVRYKTLDVYKGRVADIATKTFDIAQDLGFQLDRQHYNLLTQSVANGGAYGPFSTEQGRANTATRIYLPHTGIVTGHLPATNDYDMTATANSATNPTPDLIGAFGIEILKAVVDYADKWANVVPDAGGARLVPTGEIIVPASDIIAIANTWAPSQNVASQRIQEEINANGYTSFQYLGRTWRFIGDVTIPSGTCYPRFNMVPGKSYMKPGFDREFVETNEPQNTEKRWQRKVYGAVVISQHRPRGMRIKYI
jgi:hypothetical protein